MVVGDGRDTTTSAKQIWHNQRLHPSGDQVHRQIHDSSRRWVNRNVLHPNRDSHYAISLSPQELAYRNVDMRALLGCLGWPSQLAV